MGSRKKQKFLRCADRSTMIASTVVAILILQLMNKKLANKIKDHYWS